MTFTDYPKEETLLQPRQTQFRTEGWLIKTEHINSQNSYGEFGLTWCPLTTTHEQQTHEHLQGVLSSLRMQVPPDSRKEVRPLYQDKRGFFYSSQLFTPKVSIPFDRTEDLLRQTASISFHCRDLPNGEVVINVDYIDVYDPYNGIEEPTQEELDNGWEDEW